MKSILAIIAITVLAASAQAKPEQIPAPCANHPILQSPHGAHARAEKAWNTEALKTSEAAIHRVRLQARCQLTISTEHRVRRQIRKARSDYKAAVKAQEAANVYADIVPPGAEYLAALRWCESGGDYTINTGSGYFGAYQFNLDAWRIAGGSGYPHLASPAEQDYRAAVLYRMMGPGPWPNCP